MSRFSWLDKLFRWSAATSSQLNDLFTALVDWTSNSLSVDSMLPMSIDTAHHKEPLTFLLSDHNRHIETVAVGDPLVDVQYDHSPMGDHKIIVSGFTWYRRRDGTGTSNIHINDEPNRICWYDSVGAAWNLADFSGVRTDRAHQDNRWGVDYTYGNPWPGIGYSIGSLLFEEGGCKCIHSTMVKNTESADWPPAGQNVTRYGVFGQGSTNGRDGQAQIWLFAEDNQK